MHFINIISFPHTDSDNSDDSLLYQEKFNHLMGGLKDGESTVALRVRMENGKEQHEFTRLGAA